MVWEEGDLQAFLARLPALEWGLLVTQPNKDSRLPSGKVRWAKLEGARGSGPSGKGQLAQMLILGDAVRSGCQNEAGSAQGREPPPCVLHGVQEVICWLKSLSHFGVE